MNPTKFAQMMKYLTRVKKEKPDLPDVFPASKAPIPPVREDVETTKMFNRFNQANPRTEKADGGMLVKPGFGGTRQGYKGPKKDSSVIAKKIEEVNKGFKFYTYDSLAKEIPGFNSGSNLQIYIKNNDLPKLESFNKKVEKAWISLFEDGDRSAKTVYKPLIKIREMVGGGQKDYGTGRTKRVRTDSISDALKKSDILVWDDIKPVISKLNSDNFINSLNRKGIDYTIADVEYSAYNKTGMLRAPKTDAEHLMDYVIRHTRQSDSPLYAIYDSKTNKRITNLNNIDSYHDIYFKSESPFQDTTKYDMDYLKTKARKDPLFKEYFNLQDELLEMKNREFWPDGSRIIDPKTGKGTTFGKWSGSLYKHGYGYTKSFERFPYDTDHKFGVGKHPFKDLAILPQRINIALGSVKQKNRGDLSKKIGAEFFRNLSVDDLMMQEKDFGKKILIFDKDGKHIGKKLETPYQNAKRMVKYYNDLDLFEAGRGPKPEFPLSEFQKPDQAVPIEKRLETFKQNQLLKDKRVVPPKSRPGQGGFIATELIPGVTKTSRRIIGGAAGFVLPEVLFYQLDKRNRMSKGVSEEEAEAAALQSASLGALKDTAYMNNLKKVGESMGVDSRSFDAAYDMNVLLKNYEQNSLNFQDQYLNLLETGDEKRALDLEKNFDEYKKRTQNQYALLSNNISDNVMNTVGASPLIMEQGRKNITQEQFEKPFKDLQKAAVQKLKDEKIRAFDVQKKQSDTAAGSIGSSLLSNVFNVQSLPRASKFLFDLVNPLSPLPKYSDYLSDAEKENQMLRSLEPSDLNLVNLARGYTIENLREADIDSPILAGDIENLRYERPGVFFAGGGIAKIAGVDSGPPPESGPNPQGLSYLMKRDKNI
jgi:hypothetical protein